MNKIYTSIIESSFFSSKINRPSGFLNPLFEKIFEFNKSDIIYDKSNVGQEGGISGRESDTNEKKENLDAKS